MSVRDEIEALRNEVMHLKNRVSELENGRHLQREMISSIATRVDTSAERHNDLAAIVQALIETMQRINDELNTLRNETHGDGR